MGIVFFIFAIISEPQIRNSLRYVTHQDSKKVVKGLRAIYQARTLGEAENNLLELESTWKAKYPILVRFWLNNWE